jgi:glucose-1-phosphate adenylyltransferase
MDPRPDGREHIASGAGVTVAGIRQPLSQADQFGVIETAETARSRAFREKPQRRGRACRTRPTRSSRRWATTCSRRRRWSTRSPGRRGRASKHDLGGNIIPSWSSAGRRTVYDFSRNEVPGATDRDRGYWRDVGTLDAFYDAHMDLISVDPSLQPLQPQWPILSWRTRCRREVRVRGHGRTAARSTPCLRRRR